MKKAISILISALLITGLFTACNSTPEPSQVENIPNISSTPSAEVPIVTNTPEPTEEEPEELELKNVHIEDAVITLAVNEQARIQIEEETEDAPKIIWNSDDKNVAVVNQEGVVTGKNEGTALITGHFDKQFVYAVVVVSEDGASTTYDNSKYSSYSDAYSEEAIKLDLQTLANTVGISYSDRTSFMATETETVEHGEKDALTVKRELIDAFNRIVNEKGCSVVGCKIVEGENDWSIQVSGRESKTIQ